MNGVSDPIRSLIEHMVKLRGYVYHKFRYTGTGTTFVRAAFVRCLGENERKKTVLTKNGKRRSRRRRRGVKDGKKGFRNLSEAESHSNQV